MTWTRGTRQASASGPLPNPVYCQLNSFPSFPLSALATDLGLGCPLPGFPIRPSQRLGSCDPGISWLDMAVNSDLDLDKRSGSGLQQVCCSARDFSLAPVPSPSSATRLGIAGSLSRSGLAPHPEDVLASVEVDSDKDVPASAEMTRLRVSLRRSR